MQTTVKKTLQLRLELTVLEAEFVVKLYRANDENLEATDLEDYIRSAKAENLTGPCLTLTLDPRGIDKLHRISQNAVGPENAMEKILRGHIYAATAEENLKVFPPKNDRLTYRVRLIDEE